MKTRKINKKIAIAVGIVLIIIAVVAIRSKQSGVPPIPLQTARVQRGTVVSSVSGNGVLEAISTVEVKSNVGGQVVELAVDEGDIVKAGQLIARIDPADTISGVDQAKADYSAATSKVSQSSQALNMQRLQTTANIASAQQALESSRQRLLQAEQEAQIQPKLTSEAIKQTQSKLESAKASLNQIKSALTPQKLASAKAAYEDAKANYTKAQRNLDRQNALLEKGFVSKSDVDDAQAQFASAQAQLDTTKNKQETIKAESDQDLYSAEAKVAQAQSALESALANRVQDKLKRGDLAAARATVKQAMATLASAKAAAYQNSMKGEDIVQSRAQMSKAEAALTNAQTQLQYTTVTAPRDGVVVKKYVEKGSIVTAGRQAMAGSGSGVTIVDIADISRMRVAVDVDETDISKITLGQLVDVKVDAFPDKKFTAKVIKIAPIATVTSNVTTVPVTVELDNTSPELKPAMNATCDFVIQRKDNVLYVPVEALTATDRGMEISVLNGTEQSVQKIVVGVTGDDYAEVVSGLSEGQVVVIPEDDASTKASKSRGPGGPGGPPPGM